MSRSAAQTATRPPYDPLIKQLAAYATSELTFSAETYKTTRYCLLDSIGCAIAALKYPACTQVLGPEVPEATMTNGARVLGTPHCLAPSEAAFSIGAMIRWLDFNDTWLAREWGHPSDNLGAILAIGDYLSRQGDESMTMHRVMNAMIKAYEIQGSIALTTAFNRVGIDHVILVRVASTAVVASLMGFDTEKTMDALTLAWLDGGALRTYRHAPNTGSRKSWAAGDACRRAVQLCRLVAKGEMGYPSCMTAPKWGVHDVMLAGDTVDLSQPLSSYVMDNILFKVGFPAEFHAQTAVEAAVALHPKVAPHLDDIDAVYIQTHESAIRIIDKQGVLANPADRDHCMQYMVAAALISGELTADSYEDDFAADPQLDALRAKIHLTEEAKFTADYLDPEKRTIANAVNIVMNNGTTIGPMEIHYPLGHRQRRDEAWPKLNKKFSDNVSGLLADKQSDALRKLVVADKKLDDMPVQEFMGLLL